MLFAKAEQHIDQQQRKKNGKVSHIRRYSLVRKVCSCGWCAAKFSWEHGGATDAGSDQGGTDDRESALKDASL